MNQPCCPKVKSSRRAISNQFKQTQTISNDYLSQTISNAPSLLQFHLNNFIAQQVIARPVSLFQPDIEANAAVLHERIAGKSVLVIGGAGTIGASFVKTLLRFKPGRLYVVDINENGLTELVRDLRSTDGCYVPADFKTYPVNFGDRVFGKIIAQEGPFDIVANFAAHKHVRSEKDQYSIEAMIENNVLRAKRLLDTLAEAPPERFFCVSTDKAANPVNVMGASKKLMEEVILAYSKDLPITTARFANVAFSNGSLPAGFLERLMKRQPLSAPSDVRRYFVSPEESGQICLLACMLGEPGEIFFPKLGEGNMRTFSDIATSLLQTLGYEPELCATEVEAKAKAARFQPSDKTYPVYFFESDTSGEKPFEEFFTEEEELDLLRFRSLGVIKNAPRPEREAIEVLFAELKELFRRETVSKETIVSLLHEYIPNFEHLETGRSLDGKM
jgi:FlaA1/EpsC-like NDP-sugar epimerase